MAVTVACKYALYGLLGGVFVDGLEIGKLVRNNGGHWPEECRTLAFMIVEMIRLVAGAVLAWALASTGQIEGPFGGLAVGAAAPLILEKFTKDLPNMVSTPSPMLPKETG